MDHYTAQQIRKYKEKASISSPMMNPLNNCTVRIELVVVAAVSPTCAVAQQPPEPALATFVIEKCLLIVIKYEF
jgi:hypothetical protein